LVVLHRAGGIEPEHEPFLPCGRLLLLHHDVRHWGGLCATIVLKRVGHMVQWRILVVLLLQQHRGQAVPVVPVRTSVV
jgi:hypothetical protein